MSLSAKIREQIINSFRAELAEHIEAMNRGLLALEQQKLDAGQRSETLGNIFRAAHSLKGAARAVGVSAVEQLAHALEDILGALQQNRLEASSTVFTSCYKAIDAIQSVQAAYEAGDTTPPAVSLQALADLAALQSAGAESPKPSDDGPTPEPAIPPARPTKKSAGKNNTQRELHAAEAVSKLFTEPVAASEIPTAADLPTDSEPQVAAPAAPPASQPDETIRVSVSKLDALMAQLSELLITKIHAEQRMEQVQQAQEYMEIWQKDWLAARNAYSYLSRQSRENQLSEDARQRETQRRRGNGGGISSDLAFDETRLSLYSRRSREMTKLLDYIQTSQEHLREMSALINDLSRQYSSDTMQMSLVIDGLEEEIKRVRMLPLNTITSVFRRMVRDLAQVSKKEIQFEIIGGEVELDKRVLEQIKDPIVHMLRNAIDHGIESPEKRLAAGKPLAGTVTLEARHIGKDVSLTIADDGVGLNIATIRQTALRKGVANAQVMTDLELADLIYTSGFSTSPMITDLSGRGVGLDVVRRNVEALRGRIQTEWTPGAGSRFTMLLPLALTSSRALLVKVSGQQFAIPLNAIERIESIQAEQVLSVGGHEAIQHGDRPLMLVHMGDVLGLPPDQRRIEDAGLPVVILAAAERRLAFAVDELADEQEIVMKGLGQQLARVGGIAGASLMGSGEVLLILNVADLIKLAQRGTRRSVIEKAPTEAAERPQRHILVVDDSITTRTLEKNILEAAGFQVSIAMDGLEAFNAVSSGDLPDLIISDIAMPRMDGMELAQRMKGNEHTAHIPFILVTSFDSPEDKARGIEVGADAYIVKRSFDQNNLLETIEQLL